MVHTVGGGAKPRERRPRSGLMEAACFHSLTQRATVP